MKKLILLSIIAIVLAGCSTLYKEPVQPEIAAFVNRVPIAASTLDRAYASLPPQYKQAITKDAFLDELISEELIVQEAEKNGFFASKDEIDSIINQIRAASNMTTAQFEKSLIDRKTSIKELKASFERQIKISRFINSTFGQISVSENEVSDYYLQNPEQFAAQEGQIRASHILVSTIDEAKEVIELYKKGSPFGGLAIKYSGDLGSASRGGDLGFFDNSTMVPEFSEAAFSMEEGQLSEPVKTQFGYHVILRTSNSISFEEAKPLLAKSLRVQKGEVAIRIFLQQLKSAAVILKGNQTVGMGLKYPFRQYSDEVCIKDGKPSLKVYATSACPSCEKGIRELNAALPKDKFSVQILELNTGDDLFTPEKESGIKPEDLLPFTQKNPQAIVPFYDFGCKYFRVANAYPQGGDEEAEFSETLNKILAES